MDTEQQVAEAEVPEVIQSEGEQQQPDPAVVKRARDMGWVPPDEWRGDPPKGGFRTPEEFVQRGEEVLPIVKSQLRTAEDRAAKLEQDLAKERKESGEKFAKLEKMGKVALDRQRAQLVAEFEAKKEALIETGDVKGYRELNKEQTAALADFDKTAAPDEPEDKGDKGKTKDKDDDALPESMKQTIKAWVDERAWFTSDKEMHNSANAEHERLLKAKPGLSLAENLAAVDAYVRKRYPEKFADAQDDADDDSDEPARVSRVEGGSRINGAGGKSAWSKLPAEAKAQADKFIKDDKLFLEKGETVEKNLAQARERYAAQYLES
jgi:hypothetical protein